MTLMREGWRSAVTSYAENIAGRGIVRNLELTRSKLARVNQSVQASSFGIVSALQTTMRSVEVAYQVGSRRTLPPLQPPNGQAARSQSPDDEAIGLVNGILRGDTLMGITFSGLRAGMPQLIESINERISTEAQVRELIGAVKDALAQNDINKADQEQINQIMSGLSPAIPGTSSAIELVDQSLESLYRVNPRVVAEIGTDITKLPMLRFGSIQELNRFLDECRAFIKSVSPYSYSSGRGPLTQEAEVFDAFGQVAQVVQEHAQFVQPHR
jgi:hypothetical protein